MHFLRHPTVCSRKKSQETEDTPCGPDNHGYGRSGLCKLRACAFLSDILNLEAEIEFRTFPIRRRDHYQVISLHNALLQAWIVDRNSTPDVRM